MAFRKKVSKLGIGGPRARSIDLTLPNLITELIKQDETWTPPAPIQTVRDAYARTKQEEQLVSRMHGTVEDWRPPDLPDLSSFSEIILDLETTGLRWWENDRLIGMGLYTPDGIARYLPVCHRVGPNIPEETFFEWCRRELRDKRVVNIRTKFDLHMLRADGIDLEAQGCTFGDVAHYAALLNDHRREFNQEALALAYLPGEQGKVRAAHGFELDPGKFAEYPAGLVAPRAEGDVRIVHLLQDAMWPRLTEQGLHRVREVEDQIIPVVVEMEHNGAPIDVEMLNDWCTQAQKDVEDLLWKIQKDTGCRLETPQGRDGIVKLFSVLRLPMPTDAATGKPTIADDALATIDHPTVLDLRTAIALASLLSKFLLKYQRTLDSHGILRYELHQLPYQYEKEGASGGGAVSGRFSSAAMTYYDEHGKERTAGGNIQQVFGVKSQLNPKQTFNPTQAYIIRKLFKPDRKQHPEAVWFAADMRQIEYRRFVHYSGSKRLIKSYQDDPLTDYHQMVHGLIQQHTGKDFERTHVKNLNFASLYGAGLLKIAIMVGEIDERTWLELRTIQERSGFRVSHTDPRIAKTRVLYETYHDMFPEVKRLLHQASDLAERRGYVHTIIGRRARFDGGSRFYSALNRVIQGTAADDHKVALIDVHRERHRLGFLPRMTLHDEINGDLFDPGMMPEMARFLNEQRLECKVPILWSSAIGQSWAEAK